MVQKDDVFHQSVTFQKYQMSHSLQNDFSPQISFTNWKKVKSSISQNPPPHTHIHIVKFQFKSIF